MSTTSPIDPSPFPPGPTQWMLKSIGDLDYPGDHEASLPMSLVIGLETETGPSPFWWSMLGGPCGGTAFDTFAIGEESLVYGAPASNLEHCATVEQRAVRRVADVLLDDPSYEYTGDEIVLRGDGTTVVFASDA